MIRDLLRRFRVAGEYSLGHLRRRDPLVWVFGNVKGFRDNPRYLAEYLVDNHPELEPWWVARTSHEADAARAAGMRVALLGDPESTRIQRRARVAFLSNGFQDLQGVHLGGAYVVDLRHGKGLKRILMDHEPADASRSRARSLAHRVRRWFVARRLAQVDLIVAGGEWAKSMYVSAFRCPPSKVQVLGSPRFDVILGGPPYARVAGGDLRQQLDLRPDQYVALWLPTWREDGDSTWLPRLEAADVDAAWSKRDIILLVKRHPYSDPEMYRSRLPRHARIRLLPEEAVDVNCLLRVADALVTDYSSAAFDYALLDRPIHFFVPDLEAYRGGQGLYEPLETLTGGTQYTEWPPLLSAIAEATHGPESAGRVVARRIRERSRNNDAPGSSARITAAVAQAIGLSLSVHGRVETS